MILSYKLFENTINKKPEIGELVICVGDVDNLSTHNHIGILRKNGVQFLNRFSDKLHDLDGEISNNNGWFIKNMEWVKSFNMNKVSNNNIHLLYSNRFRDVVFYGLNFLIDYEKIFFTDASYIDLTNRNDTVSCLMAKDYLRLENGEDPWTSSMRQNLRIGRFLKKIIDDDDDVIEDFINDYKFSYSLKKENFGRFKIAKGINMAKWFLALFYAEGGGTLHASCMRHVKSQRRLPIYVNNANKIKMVYLTDPEGKLLGRALLWKLDEPEGMTYMDRIYSADDYIEKLFMDYARKKGFLTRTEVDKKNMTLIVRLGKDFGPPNLNPFMDTFKYFVKNGAYLTNKFRNYKQGEFWEYVDHD